MTRQIPARFLPLVLSLALLAPAHMFGALRSETVSANSDPSSTNSTATRTIKPGADDGRIAYVTARLLEKLHYTHEQFDDSVSSKFLDSYLESLDPQHLHFLQSDLAQFERYRTNLDNLTINRRGSADVSPAYEIFSRFLERLRQRVAYADDLLDHHTFVFTNDDKIAVDRRDVSYPDDLDAAKKLWLERLRYEYLQEKLNLEDTNSTAKSSVDSSDEKQVSTKSIHDQIVEKLKHRYHRTLKLFADWNNEDVMGIYLTALTHVYDPHSDYFNKAQLDSFSISMNLQLFGIGAELLSDDGYCKIQRLLPGGPAAKSKKIHEGDRIVAVAQGKDDPVDVVDWSLTKVVQLIRGPKGTTVRLTILPAGSSSAQKEVTLVRDEIPLDDQAAKGKIIEMPDEKGGHERRGVIDLPSFYAQMDLGTAPMGGKESDARSTSADVAKLLTKFEQEHVSGVILDLRRNGGGSLEEAIKTTGLFIKEGPVVQVRDSNGSVQVDKDTDPSITYGGPLIVLTSRFSASASEIVAGALQDYGRAIIVGDTSTHGKGTVQTLTSLEPFMELGDPNANDAGALKVTIRKFYRASGASTQLKGVMPDIVLPSIWNYSKDVGEKSLDNPLPWDTIRSANYQKVDLVQPYLPELLKRSNERTATNQDFVYVRQDIARFRKQQDDKTVSLNEADRLKEMREDEARQKARDKEREARPKPDEKIYDISLKQAGEAGLPPAESETNSVASVSGDNSTATNSVASNSSSSDDSASVDSSDDSEDKAPAVDVDLVEAEHIMTDYLSVLPKNESLVANH